MRASRSANGVVRQPKAPDSTPTAQQNWRIDRRTLFASTALASTLLACGLLAPTAASAQQAISIIGSPTAISTMPKIASSRAIVSRSPPTVTARSSISGNSGDLTGGQRGIYTRTFDANSAISIVNTGVISSGYLSSYSGDGIFAVASGPNSSVTITNSGAIAATSGEGIFASGGTYSSTGGNPVTINNSADISSRFEAIYGEGYGDNSPVVIINSGNLDSDRAEVIDSFTNGDNSPITIINSGNGQAYAQGLEAAPTALTAPSPS